jgi:tetratricopeptide (TPR) repeat protein
MRRARERAVSVVAALVMLAVAWGAASAHPVSAQAGGATTSSAQAKQRFVSALTQFLEAVAGTYGDEEDLVRRSLDSLQAALAAWDAAIGSMQSGLRANAGVEARFALGVAYLDRLRLDEALREFAAVNDIDRRYAEVHVFSGIAYSLQGRHAEAAAAFAAASRLEPEDPATLYRLAHSLQRTGRNEDAAEMFRRFADAQRRRLSQPAAVTGGPAFARVDLLRQVPGAVPIFPPGIYAEGMAALRAGRYGEAIDLFKKAAAADPLTGNATTGQIGDGAAALRTGALSAAIDHFTSAVALDPKSSEAHRLAGMAYWADEQYERSIDHLQTAVRLNPDDDRARVALGDVFAASGRVTEAEQAFRDAVKVIPASGLAQYRLGRLLYDFPEKWPDATNALEESLRLHPLIGSDLISQMLTRMHLVSLNLDAAVESGRRRIEANPNHAEAYRVLGEVSVQQGRDRDAVPQFLAALLVEPGDAASWAALAQSQLRTGEYAAAESSARRAIQIDSTLAGAQFVLANALIRLGRADEGARELERFQRMQTEAQAREAREWELKMLNQEASARLQNGDQEQAIAALRTAVALAPDIASGYVSLGAVLKSAGRHAEAIEQFRKALELSADPAACRLLVESYEALGQADEAARYRVDCVRLKEERVRSGSWRK